MRRAGSGRGNADGEPVAAPGDGAGGTGGVSGVAGGVSGGSGSGTLPSGVTGSAVDGLPAKSNQAEPVLLGIALVINGSSGHQLVFRYPVDEASARWYPDASAGGTAAGGRDGVVGTDPHAAPASPTGGPVASAAGTTSAATVAASGGGDGDGDPDDGGPSLVFGLPHEIFALAMSPKPLLCGRPFELRVDDYVFLGRPTVVLSLAALRKQRQSVRRRRRRTAAATSSASSNGGNAPTPAPVDGGDLASPGHRPSARTPTGAGFDDSVALDRDDDDAAVSSLPLGFDAYLEGQPGGAGHGLGDPWAVWGSSGASQVDMSNFDVVFVLNRKATDPTTVARFRSICKRVSAALHYEQKRTGFISREIATIVALREDWVDASRGDEAGGGVGGGRGGGGGGGGDGGGGGGLGGGGGGRSRKELIAMAHSSKELAQKVTRQSELASVWLWMIAGLRGGCLDSLWKQRWWLCVCVCVCVCVCAFVICGLAMVTSLRFDSSDAGVNLHRPARPDEVGPHSPQRLGGSLSVAGQGRAC